MNRERYDAVIQYALEQKVNLSAACRAIGVERNLFAGWHAIAKREGFAPDPSLLTTTTGPRFNSPPRKKKIVAPTDEGGGMTTVRLESPKTDDNTVTIISCKMSDIASILKHLKH